MDKAFGQIRAALGAMSLRKKFSLLVVFGLMIGGFVYLINYSGRPYHGRRHMYSGAR